MKYWSEAEHMKFKAYFMKKYELTDETKEFDGKTLYRIRALIDFGLVKAGDFGGWIEKEEKIKDKQDNDNIDQYNIECEQGEHSVHNAMDNNLSPERWDARDYHINHAQCVASIADFKEWKKSHEIHLKNLLKDFNQQFNSDQVKQTTINNIMTGM